MMHAIFAKPYLEGSIAQIASGAGSKIVHCNRCGSTAAYEIVIVKEYHARNKNRAVDALRWFISYDVKIRDREDISPNLLSTFKAIRARIERCGKPGGCNKNFCTTWQSGSGAMSPTFVLEEEVQGLLRKELNGALRIRLRYCN